MKQAFLDHSISFIMQNQTQYTEDDKEKLLYGLEGLYLTITKTIILFFISFLIGFTKELFICLILFNILRYPAFGFHADNSEKCLIFSGIFFLGFPYLLLNIHLSEFSKLILYFISFVTFLICAPADTEKRPLTNKKKRTIRKLASIVLVILYGIGIFLINNPFSDYLLIVILMEAIFISPLPYLLFRQPYQNYKKPMV